jgi:hypothetical protein
MHPLANRKTALIPPDSWQQFALAALGWEVLIAYDHTVLMGSPKE